MISIIYPVYNVVEYIEKSIESCLMQTFHDFEIIAVNDGSTDGSYDILCEYAKQDTRIKIINQINQGVAIARMVGLSKSSGEYVTFVDSDDILPADALEILYATICYDVDIAVGDYLELMNGKYIKTESFSNNIVISPVQYIDLILSQRIQWGLCAKLYKRKLFENIVTVPEFKLGEDAALLVQIISNSRKIALINKCIYYYIQRVTSAVHAKSVPHIVDVYKFRVWIMSFLQERKYCNEYLLRKFVVMGYLECILLGGRKFLSNTDYLDVRPFYQEVKGDLLLWHKIVFWTFDIPVIGRFVVKGLFQIRRMKLFFVYR